MSNKMMHSADPAYMRRNFIRFTSKVGTAIYVYKDTPISAILDCGDYRKIYTEKHFYMVAESLDTIFSKFRQFAIDVKDVKKLQ